MSRSKDDRGQVLSSLVAVAAVVAIVAGLLVLFGTRGDGSAAGSKPAAKTSAASPRSATSTPVSTPTAPTSATTTTPVPTSASTSGPPSASTRPSENQPTTPGVTPTQIPAADLPAVEVFNNTVRKGLADEVAAKARAAGWKVAGADNWHGKIVTSTVYYPAGMQAEAAQLAGVLGIGRIKDALPNMKKDRLSVILTSDYSG